MTLLIALASRAVIDFLEELVVLLDRGVGGRELQRLLVRPTGLVQLAFVFVSNSEVIVRFGVARIDLDGALPTIDCLTPEAACGHCDTKLNLLLGVVARARAQRWRGEKRERQGHQCGLGSHLWEA